MTHTGRAALLVCALVAISLLGPGAAHGDLPLGSSPPAFVGSAGDWINSPPPTWDQLKGKVVMVDFWEYTCVNCIRTYPYLKAWDKRYAPYGLVIIGIHRPEFDFAKSKENVAAAARRAGLRYPILNDPKARNWRAYHEHSWPSKYIFDQSGRLVDQHVGEGEYRETELLIQRLLHKARPGVKFPPPLPPQRPGDRPGVVCREETPEQYANPRASEGSVANLPGGWRINEVATFTDRKPHVDGKIFVSGVFIPRRQSLQHGRQTSDLRDHIALRYRATEVNVVVNRPGGRDYKVYATLDGKAIPRSYRGDDVRYDSRGSYLDVTAARMYNVIRGPFGVHELVLASDSPDFDFYSYTFSGCPQK